MAAADVVVEDPTARRHRRRRATALSPATACTSIARKTLGSGRFADQVYELNRDAIGPNPTKLRLGMVLRLPNAAVATNGTADIVGGALGGGVAVLTDASN